VLYESNPDYFAIFLLGLDMAGISLVFISLTRSVWRPVPITLDGLAGMFLLVIGELLFHLVLA